MKKKKGDKNMPIYLLFKYQNTFNNAMFKWFSTLFSLGAPVKSSDTVDEKKLVSQYSTPFEIQVYFYSKTLDIN